MRGDLLVFGQESAGEEAEAEDMDDDVTVMELEQNGATDDVGVAEDLAGGVPGVGENEDDDEDDVVDPEEVSRFVDKHIEKGFLSRKKWPLSYEDFKRPGDGYWKDDDEDGSPIEAFVTSTPDRLEKAEQRCMPAYIPYNALASEHPKGKYEKEGQRYRCCKKIAVTSDGKTFRATDKEILDSLRKSKLDSHGMSAEFYVKVAAETLRRHQISEQATEPSRARKENRNKTTDARGQRQQRRQQQQQQPEEEEEEEEGESDAESAPRGRKRSRVRLG